MLHLLITTLAAVGPAALRPQEGAPVPAETLVPSAASAPTQEPLPSTAPTQDPAGTPPAVPNAEPVPVPVPELPTWEPKYHDLDSVRALLERFAADATAAGLVAERLELGLTHSGLPSGALRLGRAEGGPLATRPALLLLGGLDGTSLTGSEAVLAVLAHVVAHPTELPPGTTLLAVPWAAPEALARTLQGAGDGRDGRPVDDDGDRKLDEDGPDDLDGDGQILELLIEDPDGAWARGADSRFLVPAKPGDSPRYRRMAEGRDDDGDGRFNEDPPGGQALMSAFPDGFAPSGSLSTGLTLPLEDEQARSLCTLIAKSRALAVLALQGDHGALAPVALDTPAERASAELAARALARPGARVEEPLRSAFELGRDPGPGSALRWTRARLGAFVAEWAPWGPEVERAASGAAASPAAARRDGEELAVPLVVDANAALERAWARWLDDTRGGIGFVEWHPVDLGPGRRALVGGWLPFTRRNAPEVALANVLAPVPAGVLRLLAQFPRLEPVFTEARREGELCFLRARVSNKGGFACSSAENGAGKLAVRLVLGGEARLVAGSDAIELEPLAGGAASREYAWIVLAPAQSTFTCRVDLPWGGSVAAEVRP
ncbi:MAG: hypothetical protein IPJ77_19815 [Planctomycetes bacterium]|nr:hypothetical protein [Planctomycetota bacterium]